MTFTSGERNSQPLRLSAKNAILIVEFAKDLMDKEGKGLIEATLDAVRMRLRPDDLAGVYPRRYAAGYQYWCWFRRAERSRYRCNGQDGDRNGTGNLLRSGIRCGGFATALATEWISSTAILSIIIDTTCNH